MSTHEIQPAITGKVAEVTDQYTLIINRGEVHGVTEGMIFVVQGNGPEVKDPDTGESLGPRPYEKLRVKVIEVYPKFCVAQTYRIVTPKAPGLDFMLTTHMTIDEMNRRGFSPFGPARPEREHIVGGRKPEDSALPTSAAARVKVGDTVRELSRP